MAVDESCLQTGFGPQTALDAYRRRFSIGAEGAGRRQARLPGAAPQGGGEYEYAISVPPEDVPKARRRLGRSTGADVIALIKANAEAIVRQGEQTWIMSLGITPGFWAHSSD